MSADDKIVLEILEPAMQYVQKCPVDSRIIDTTFPALACPVCRTSFCMFPCVESLAAKNKKCPTCKEFEMRKLSEILQSVRYLAKLEELKAKGDVTNMVYGKLKREYEERNRDAIQRIYG